MTLATAYAPSQVDGEPFVQAPCAVHISRRGQGLVLRRVQSKPLAKMMQALSEVLEESEHRGTITPAQHHALMAELSSRLQPLLLHPA
jgi:diacylglycerol kinase (ATP)